MQRGSLETGKSVGRLRRGPRWEMMRASMESWRRTARAAAVHLWDICGPSSLHSRGKLEQSEIYKGAENPWFLPAPFHTSLALRGTVDIGERYIGKLGLKMSSIQSARYYVGLRRSLEGKNHYHPHLKVRK